jgi:hypothetical protein
MTHPTAQAHIRSQPTDLRQSISCLQYVCLAVGRVQQGVGSRLRVSGLAQPELRATWIFRVYLARS